MMRAPHDVVVRPFTGSDTQWDTFAALHGTIFHTAQWLRVMERNQPAHLMRLGVYADGRQVGILPLFVRRYFPFKIGASPLVVDNTPYQGIACEAGVLREAIDAVGSYATLSGIHFLRLFQREHFADDERTAATTYVDKHTHVIDLAQPEDVIWKRMEGRTRTGIRKAEKTGVTVVRESSRDCIAPYYAMLSELYLAQKMVTPNSLEFYHELWDEFEARGLFLLTARHEGRMIAGAIFVKAGDWVYYLNGCSLSEYNRFEPNRAIQWHAIRLGKSMGARHHDFVGSDIERLAKFKKSFGGELITYTLVERASAPWVVTARRAFPKVMELRHRILSRIRKGQQGADGGALT